APLAPWRLNTSQLDQQVPVDAPIDERPEFGARRVTGDRAKAQAWRQQRGGVGIGDVVPGHTPAREARLHPTTRLSSYSLPRSIAARSALTGAAPRTFPALRPLASKNTVSGIVVTP